MPTLNSSRKRKIFLKGLAKIALGLVVAAGSVYLFMEFTRLETEGGSLRLNRYLLMLYKAAGKWVTCGFLLLSAAYVIYQGFQQVTKPGRKAPSLLDV